MIKIFSRLNIAILSVVAFLGLVIGPLAGADWNYITLSPYYVLPGQTVSVSGAGFGSGESINVSLAGLNQTVTASGGGTFTTAGFTVPNSAVGSKVTVTASGNQGHTSTATLTVGGFYPVVQPSNYYVVPGSTVNFTGQHFQPNEPITISGPGSSNTTADGGGSFTTANFSVPTSGGNQTYIFTGQNSHSSYSVTIHVSGTTAVIVLSNYYGYSGSGFSVSGRFFGSGEKVNVSMGGISLGQATADGSGNFSLGATVPNFPASGVQTITATGQTTSKTAVAQFTMAWNNLVSSGQNQGVTVSVVQVQRPTSNVASGTSITITPQLIATGGTAQNVTIHVQLNNASTSQLSTEQVYSNQTLTQNVPMNFALTTPPLMPKTYTIATIVNNADNSILASFGNLGTIVVQ